VKDICDTCHNAAGSGTTKHSNGTVDVAFLTNYSAKSGTATITPDKSCANVSCHGGVTTPVWGGTINVASDCASCHVRGTGVQTPQFNSYFSGQHTLHINQIGLQCTDCHDMNQTNGGASHFSGLATPVFELAPRFTIRVPGYATTPGSCNPRSNLSVNYSISNAICHGAESWQ
jgi:predicted CxxxxCH...CXXCH cytochrome family protein